MLRSILWTCLRSLCWFALMALLLDLGIHTKHTETVKVVMLSLLVLQLTSVVIYSTGELGRIRAQVTLGEPPTFDASRERAHFERCMMNGACGLIFAFFCADFDKLERGFFLAFFGIAELYYLARIVHLAIHRILQMAVGQKGGVSNTLQ